jgi:hypothetical protein
MTENRTGVWDTASQPWKKEEEVTKEVGGCAVILYYKDSLFSASNFRYSAGKSS